MPGKLNEHDPEAYAVSEIFLTVQGEGVHAGTPAVFVRLQGCDVGCGWCDTKHSWPLPQQNAGGGAYDPTLVPEDRGGGFVPHGWRWMSVAEVVDGVRSVRGGANMVVITGGEPAMHHLEHIVSALSTAHMAVCVETSGTHTIAPHVLLEAFVCVSPKIGMSGGHKLQREVVRGAREIKMPVGRRGDIDNLVELLAYARHGTAISLQPLSLSKRATEMCVHYAVANGWRVSLQQHKLMLIR